MQDITPELEHYLQSVHIPIRLSCVTTSGWPLIVSLWYLYEDGKFYCATQEKSKIVSYLRENPRCGFEVAGDDPPYCGVRGKGEAIIDESQGAMRLEQLITRYVGDTQNSFAQKLLSRRDTEVAIVIQPASLYTWNFKSRMNPVVDDPNTKVCPE